MIKQKGMNLLSNRSSTDRMEHNFTNANDFRLCIANRVCYYGPVFLCVFSLLIYKKERRWYITLSYWNFHLLQAANCCRNSCIIVDEDDLKWVENGKKLSLLLKQLRENCRSISPMCRKLSHSSELQNYAFMHREGLTLSVWGPTLDVRIWIWFWRL